MLHLNGSLCINHLPSKSPSGQISLNKQQFLVDEESMRNRAVEDGILIKSMHSICVKHHINLSGMDYYHTKAWQKPRVRSRTAGTANAEAQGGQAAGNMQIHSTHLQYDLRNKRRCLAT